MYHRRKLLLSLLAELDRAVPDGVLQHLLLLVAAEQAAAGAKPAYEFVPTSAGGRSFQAEADKSALIKYGLLCDGRDWRLASGGAVAAIEPHASDAAIIANVVRRVGRMSDRELATVVFREHPYYAIHCERRHELLTRRELAAVDAAAAHAGGHQLFTIGYEGRSLEAYLNALIPAGVRVLVDVRRNPLSMKFGFSKRTLARAAQTVGIGYVHLPELGIASAKRAGLASEADYRALFDEYRRTTLVDNGAALERIGDLLRERGRIALTCFEARAADCHRGCVAEALRRTRRRGTRPLHL